MLKILKKRFGGTKSKDKKTEAVSSQLLDEQIPRMIMHSYSGSKEIAQSLSTLPLLSVYFSFCQLSSEVASTV